MGGKGRGVGELNLRANGKNRDEGNNVKKKVEGERNWRKERGKNTKWGFPFNFFFFP